jgi:hypothetical protein
MRIVSKQEFYTLPEGTVFSFYEPCIIRGLLIKGETLFYDGEPGDFIHNDLIGNIECSGSDEYDDKLEDSQENGTNMPLDFENTSRDGLYDEDALYAVYTPEDVQGLIDCLAETLIKKPSIIY